MNVAFSSNDSLSLIKRLDINLDHLLFPFVAYVEIYIDIMKPNIINGPRREKTCLRGFANNTGTDQPAHPRSLISAFVVLFLKRSIC